MEENTIFLALIIVFLLVLMVLAYLGKKYLDFQETKEDNRYLIAKRKLRTVQNEDEDDDVKDFSDSLPVWLSSMVEGAGLDLNKIYKGDEGELLKVKSILDKHLPKGGAGIPEDVIR